MLIIDDEDAIRVSIAKYLNATGYKAETAATLDEALASIENVLYDIALVDLQLGNRSLSDGLQLVETIRRVAPSTRLLVLTGNDSLEVQLRLTPMGVEMLQKPISLKTLVQVLESARRLPWSCEVGVAVADEKPETYYATDLSLTGTLVIMPQPLLPTGTLISLFFFSDPPVRCLGEVKRQMIGRGSSGIGVKFLDLNEPTREALRKLVHHTAQGIGISLRG